MENKRPITPAELFVETARAKINLTLEIKGKRSDGYHDLEGLVLFADHGDVLEFHPGPKSPLIIDGPFASGLDAGVNLVEAAAAAFADCFRVEPEGKFHLSKHIPVAAGLGGGSADAAAALRLLRKANDAPKDLSALISLAQKIGADVPCCLFSRAALMTGIGEKLRPLRDVPPIPAVLVNPMQSLATGDVFRKLNAAPLAETLQPPQLPQLSTIDDVVHYAQERRNDLEPPARELAPVVGEVLMALRAQPSARLARLSGSGPTCFALFTTMADAETAASSIASSYPAWWVRPVQLS